MILGRAGGTSKRASRRPPAFASRNALRGREPKSRDISARNCARRIRSSFVTWPISSSNRLRSTSSFSGWSVDLRDHVLIVPVPPHDLHEGQVVALRDEDSELLQLHRHRLGCDLRSGRAHRSRPPSRWARRARSPPARRPLPWRRRAARGARCRCPSCSRSLRTERGRSAPDHQNSVGSWMTRSMDRTNLTSSSRVYLRNSLTRSRAPPCGTSTRSYRPTCSCENPSASPRVASSARQGAAP